MNRFFDRLAMTAARLATFMGRRAGPPRWTAVGLTSAMNQAEVLLMEGSVPRAREWLSLAEPPILRMEGPNGARLRARYRAMLGDLAAWTGQRERAIEQLQQALFEVESVEDETESLELRTRIEAALGLMATVEDPEGLLAKTGRRAVERHRDVHRPDVLMRLAWLTNRLAQIEHVRGRWDAARELFERSVEIGLRLGRPGASLPDSRWDDHARELFWSNGRKASSEAARDIGFVLRSLGDYEGAIHWLDQAVTVIEGARHPIAKVRLAEALLDRATQDPADPLAGTGGREAMMQRAVEIGHSCDNTDGRAAACMAEVALANLYSSLGMTKKNAEHLRSALELTRDMAEPAAGHNATYLLMALGHALDESGDRAAAVESLRKSIERGRSHTDPETRKFAASAAYRLHQLSWEDNRVSDARDCVEVIEQVVPTLSAEARTVFAGIAAHTRGLQQVLENRPEDGRQWLERAETIGLQGGAATGALARSAAADQGRVALRAGKPDEAEPHLRRALETPAHQVSSTDDQAQRAEITLLLADTLRQLDRTADARRDCARAFELGRNAGNAKGREVAAIAAMWLGESADDDVAERRRYYEAASRLGRLCGRARGREVAETVDARLREVTG